MTLGHILAFGVLGALAIALTAPIRLVWLRRYLWTQVIYLPAVWGSYFSLGRDHPAYVWIYALFTAPILCCVIVLAAGWAEMKPLVFWASMFLFGVCIASWLWSGDGQSFRQAVNALEASVLAFCGCSVGFSVQYRRDKALPLCLSILWLLQALFGMGIVLHWESEFWLSLNTWLPAFLVVAAMSYLGFEMRREARA